MDRKWVVVLLSAVAIMFLFLYAALFLFIFLPLNAESLVPAFSGQGKVALIRIEGAISASGSGSGILSEAGTSSEEIVKQLRRADKDSSVKAILLRVNSPGGAAAASEEIYAQVERTKKPVIASIADIGASGAYLISCGADTIIANPSSSVGSIGTIITVPNFQELFKKLGIDYVIITEGKYKSLGDPARSITEEEKEILQKQSKIVYKQFVESVVKSRKLPREKVKSLANGLTFPGRQALQMGLVDKIGNYQDAVDQCAKMGRIKGEPIVVEYEEKTLPRWLSQIFQGKGAWLFRILAPRNLQFSPATNL